MQEADSFEVDIRGGMSRYKGVRYVVTEDCKKISPIKAKKFHGQGMSQPLTYEGNEYKNTKSGEEEMGTKNTAEIGCALEVDLKCTKIAGSKSLIPPIFSKN